MTSEAILSPNTMVRCGIDAGSGTVRDTRTVDDIHSCMCRLHVGMLDVNAQRRVGVDEARQFAAHHFPGA